MRNIPARCATIPKLALGLLALGVLAGCTPKFIERSSAITQRCGQLPSGASTAERVQYGQCSDRVVAEMEARRKFDERRAREDEEARIRQETWDKIARQQAQSQPQPALSAEERAEVEQRAAQASAEKERIRIARAQAAADPRIGWLNGTWCEGERQRATLLLEGSDSLRWNNKELRANPVFDRALRALEVDGDEFETVHQQRGFYFRNRYRRESSGRFSLRWVVATEQPSSQRLNDLGMALETWERCPP